MNLWFLIDINIHIDVNMYINIHKMEKSSLTSPKAGTLNRVFKVNITTKWSKYNHETPDRIQEKEHSLV